MGIIHGDLHHQNIQLDLDPTNLRKISRLYYIDFDFSTWIYKEPERPVTEPSKIRHLNRIQRVNRLVNQNILHVCKMIPDHCNQLITQLNLYIGPFGTPMTTSESLKVTSSNDIRGALCGSLHANLSTHVVVVCIA